MKRGFYDSRPDVPLSDHRNWHAVINEKCHEFTRTHTLAQLLVERDEAVAASEAALEASIDATHAGDEATASEQAQAAKESSDYATCLNLAIKQETKTEEKTPPAMPMGRLPFARRGFLSRAFYGDAQTGTTPREQHGIDEAGYRAYVRWFRLYGVGEVLSMEEWLAIQRNDGYKIRANPVIQTRPDKR